MMRLLITWRLHPQTVAAVTTAGHVPLMTPSHYYAARTRLLAQASQSDAPAGGLALPVDGTQPAGDMSGEVLLAAFA